MKGKLFLLLALFLFGCGFYDILVSPGDEYVQLPDGYEIKLHCIADCPDHDDIRAALKVVGDKYYPRYLDEPPYEIWSNYAITFSDLPMYHRGYQVWGATFHGSGAIYIYVDYECPPHPRGLCPGVFGWEMQLPLLNKILPFSSEREKIEWVQKEGL